MPTSAAPNSLSQDAFRHDSQITAFRGAKHFSPLTVANDVIEIKSGATNFSRTWVTIFNPAGGAELRIGYENDVTDADTNRQGTPMLPGTGDSFALGRNVKVFVFCTATQRINCSEVG